DAGWCARLAPHRYTRMGRAAADLAPVRWHRGWWLAARGAAGAGAALAATYHSSAIDRHDRDRTRYPAAGRAIHSLGNVPSLRSLEAYHRKGYSRPSRIVTVYCVLLSTHR